MGQNIFSSLGGNVRDEIIMERCKFFEFYARVIDGQEEISDDLSDNCLKTYIVQSADIDQSDDIDQYINSRPDIFQRVGFYKRVCSKFGEEDGISFETINKLDQLVRHSYFRSEDELFRYLVELLDSKKNFEIPYYDSKGVIEEILKDRKKDLTEYLHENTANETKANFGNKYYEGNDGNIKNDKRYIEIMANTEPVCTDIVWGRDNSHINNNDCKSLLPDQILSKYVLLDINGNEIEKKDLTVTDRQFVFGIGDEYKKYVQCSQYFRTMLLPLDGKKWIRWDRELNKVFTVCATKANLFFPIRFIIPYNETTKIGSLPYRYEYIDIDKLFDPSNYIFIGIIRLKVYDDKIFKSNRKINVFKENNVSSRRKMPIIMVIDIMIHLYLFQDLIKKLNFLIIDYLKLK